MITAEIIERRRRGQVKSKLANKIERIGIIDQQLADMLPKDMLFTTQHIQDIWGFTPRHLGRRIEHLVIMGMLVRIRRGWYRRPK